MPDPQLVCGAKPGVLPGLQASPACDIQELVCFCRLGLLDVVAVGRSVAAATGTWCVLQGLAEQALDEATRADGQSHGSGRAMVRAALSAAPQDSAPASERNHLDRHQLGRAWLAGVGVLRTRPTTRAVPRRNRRTRSVTRSEIARCSR